MYEKAAAVRRSLRGFSLIELMVVLAIIGIISVAVLVRYNTYEASHAARSAAQVLVNDIKLQRQKAFTLESECGIDIAPGGNLRVYTLWYKAPGGSTRIPSRTVNFSQTFRSDVTFAPVLANKTISFFPWTSGTGAGPGHTPDINEWSMSKSDYGGLTSISIYGGDICSDVRFSTGNSLKIVETPVH